MQPPLTALGQFLATAESKPVLIKYAALLLGVLLVVALGVRPAVRRAVGRTAADRERDAGAAKELAAQAAAQPPALKPPEAAEADPERARAQEIFEQVTTHLKREPTQSSRLLQSWIHSD
jgi:flagellar M-ring protein FliF